MVPSNFPLSVLIPTKNEERNIQDCLRSVQWANDIVVFDSYSMDDTQKIAEKFDARFIKHEFTNFSDHKNWALTNIDFKNAWLLIVDADERITTELAQEIQSTLKSESSHNGYYIARKNYYRRQWIKHGGWYPDFNLRLLRLGYAKYEKRLVHEHILVEEGAPGYLKQPLIHHDYKGIERYFDRHNIYSSLEAIEYYNSLKKEHKKKQLKSNFFKKGPERRRFLKHLAYRYLPCRPVFKFLWMYFFKLGFLDGRMGFRFCVLHTFYEYQISLKLEELQQANSPLREKYKKYIQDDDFKK